MVSPLRRISTVLPLDMHTSSAPVSARLPVITPPKDPVPSIATLNQHPPQGHLAERWTVMPDLSAVTQTALSRSESPTAFAEITVLLPDSTQSFMVTYQISLCGESPCHSRDNSILTFSLLKITNSSVFIPLLKPSGWT